MFDDRADAGKQLAERLARYRGEDALVLALPRGGVVVGAEVARALDLPLDILVTRKIAPPTSPEYAIGAVNERGMVLLDEAEAAQVGKRWLAAEIKREQAEALRRVTAYREGRAPLNVAGKIAIVVDDGVATGLTMRLAIRALKTLRPSRIVVAVPVAPQQAPAALRAAGADEVLVLEPPGAFRGAVGAHYRRFDQTSDAEVIAALH